jgi:hypothetical protein
MSDTPTVATSLMVRAGASPEANFVESAKYSNGFLSFDASHINAPALFLPSEASDAVAYLDALIRAACDLRNHYVEWAKTHEIALAA